MISRKYRPKTFSAINGQGHVVRTLKGALVSGRIGHAYFFAGPRGTGKTTMARLLAKALNCEKRKSLPAPACLPAHAGEGRQADRQADAEPCNQCYSCNEINAGKSLDLIEIDAASHTGVDNIREIIDSAQVAAPTGLYKIFIIDEVHMLSKSSFNALLKTLEEPPQYTMFVLATTEPHKVPETILSRVQRLDFRKLSMDEIIAKLSHIAQAEKFSIDDASLSLIAISASGSVRDAESALAKVVSYANGKITAQETSSILGVVPEEVHKKFLSHLQAGRGNEAIAQISELQDAGFNLENFIKQFIEHSRARLIADLQSHGSVDSKFLVRVIERFLEARTAMRRVPIPQLPLELAIVDLTHMA